MKHLQAILLAACAFVIAAGPPALDGKALRVILWTGAIAAAFYLKGKYEDKPTA